MYVDRGSLEDDLVDALKSTKYIAVHGESGNGKTWLYRKVLGREKIQFETLNLANVVMSGSVGAAIREKLGELGYSQQDTESTSISGGIRPQGIGMDGSKTDTYRFSSRAPLTSLLEVIRRRAGSARAVLVLDNFEQIASNEAALNEIAAIIISADEEIIARQNVKIIIVGVPGDIKALISKNANATTISNRLTEIPEVARMTIREATGLMIKGLESEIGLSVDMNTDALYKDLCWKSDLVAQHIHEVCLKVANAAVRSGGVINAAVVERAEKSWLADSLSSDWAVIESHMNGRDTRAGRRNQVIYALGQCEKEEFRYNDIETIVRREFPVSTSDVLLNPGQLLTALSKGKNPVIRRTPKGNAYRFVSPKLRWLFAPAFKRALMKK